MTIKQGTAGSKGFDCNTPLTAIKAQGFRAAGMDFVIRYLPRTPALIPGNLTTQEMEIILAAGLDLGLVQHCPLPGWTPSAALGASYGQFASTYAKGIGVPAGAIIWCDLEEVAAGTPPEAVIEYYKSWFTSVEIGGYVGALYVGYNPGLNAQQLYSLPCKAYWRAYNYDDGLAIRGFCLLQEPAQTLAGIQYDPNQCVADKLGGLPIWVSA